MSFVEQVPFMFTSVSTPYEQIEETIDYTRNYADEQKVILSTAIENLGALLEQYEPQFDTATYNRPANNLPPWPEAPDLRMTLNENWPNPNNIPEPTIRDVHGDTSFDDPTKPTPLDPTFDYTPGLYQSCLWDQLCTQIRSDLINGGTGLNDQIYGLIIDRSREALRVQEEETMVRAYDSVGANGFDLAGGQAAAVILQMGKEVHAKRVDAINSTTIKDFDLADANTKFTKELALKMEEIQVMTFNSKEDRDFEIAKVTKELALSIYEQNIKIFLAEYEGIKLRLEAVKVQIEADEAMNEGEIKIFLGRMEGLKIETEAIASQNKSVTDMTKAEADVYNSQMKGVESQANILLKEIDSALEEYRIKMDVAIKKEELNLKSYTSATELTVKVSESIAKIASQAVASALQAINTGMSFNYRGSESLGYSSGIRNNLTESHRFEEL